MGKILSKDKIKKIRFLEEKMKEAVEEMIQTEKNPAIRSAYEKFLENLKIPINFYPKDNLMRTVFKIGEHFIASEVLGEHKQNLKFVRQGNIIKVVPDAEIIEIPAQLFFHGDKVTWKGLQTLIHELCHDPMRDPFEFSKLGLNRTQREEWVTDLLSARIAVKMGYPRKRILELFRGREGVYGKFPYKKALEKAVTPKKEKEKPKAKIINLKKLREQQEREKA
ncbi:hypothetical protein KKG83_07110, partial [Candidatus Micrarchaeota archaeon]|nr:hypothetical protein [Candidatus Micrarchaeota archaeon]